MPDERAHTSTKAVGYVHAYGPDVGVLERDTLRCPHCTGHFVIQPGSGKLRSLCPRCNHVLCDICSIKFVERGFKCVHWEQLLENIESGRPDDFVPTKVAMPGKLWMPDE